MSRVEKILAALQQPSTVKGLLGLGALIGWQFTPESYDSLMGGIMALYFVIAIVWQKS